ncbi:MAG: DUF1893 domain-containing protein [Chloroflexi bacterium]|nr:DUF1893 domain-containing protein [Chloroflexota bacterium]
MYQQLFEEFLPSDDTLQIYEGRTLVFSSNKDRLLPLLDYIAQSAADHHDITIFDKIMGNAAALLSIKAGGRVVFSPLGSESAIKTLEKYGVRFHLMNIVSYIQKSAGSEEMCPMEKLSLGKDPEEFYRVMTAGVPNIVKNNQVFK